VREDEWLRVLWEGQSFGARAARIALTPVELLFGVGSAVRSSLYSSGILPAHVPAIPAIAIGNLTVGGTGKTPVAAYFAARLLQRGAQPAIVLRCYGNDEPLVHRTLNPDARVVVSPDRLAGITQAHALGCDVAVLDDAFQHRRVKRVADVVLVSADAQWSAKRRLLPAGPWREPLSAVQRAALVVVTRKAASAEDATSIVDVIARASRGVPSAVVHLDAGALRAASSTQEVPVAALRGESVLAISGIGNPGAFSAQLAERGARVTPRVFRDHHQFTRDEATRLAAEAVRFDRVICTLKDAVKLGPLWPGPSPLWYVSQRVVVERGADAVDGVIAAALRARTASPYSGRPGPPGPPI
jgi:tetraacyldisaccharide 4'-kinase